MHFAVSGRQRLKPVELALPAGQRQHHTRRAPGVTVVGRRDAGDVLSIAMLFDEPAGQRTVRQPDQDGPMVHAQDLTWSGIRAETGSHKTGPEGKHTNVHAHTSVRAMAIPYNCLTKPS